jgi:choline dehydrogenase-like flavoprotein
MAVEARDLSGDSLRVNAHEFIFAAGTIETTRLVLLLDQLTNGHAFAGCEVLGRYLQEHLGAKVADLRPRDRATTNRFFGYRFDRGTRRSLHLDLSPRAQEADRVGGAIVHSYMVPTEDSGMAVMKRLLRSRQSGDYRLSVHDMARVARQSDELVRGLFWRVVNNQHYWPADLEHQLDVWIEQQPCRENRVQLSKHRDALGVPMARVHWAPQERDERTFRACISRLKSFWSRNHIGHACDLEWIPEASDNSASVTAIAHPINHPSGTTRLGTDPRTSVVDPRFCCHLVPNLSLASASVFPTAGSAGPTYTLAEIALALADRVGASVARERVSAH